MENENYEIMNAQTFYEKNLASQRRLVNISIKCAMEKGKYTIKLPTQLYGKIEDELKELGWEEEIVDKEPDIDDDGVSLLYPVCVCEGCDLPEVTGIHELISAQEFYEATLKNQYKDLWHKMDEASRLGYSEVRLDYKAYPTVITEMEQKGWIHVFLYTDINTKVEEYSLFYPGCGFDEEEE